jgi:hypothetical protein
MTSFVPEQNITAPAYTKTVIINITVANCHIDSCTITGYYFNRLSFSYDNDTIPAQLIPLPFIAEEKTVTIALLSLQYYTSRGMITDLRWLPCGVAAGYLK